MPLNVSLWSYVNDKVYTDPKCSLDTIMTRTSDTVATVMGTEINLTQNVRSTGAHIEVYNYAEKMF